ncbi:uncharacterized protein ACIBXB_004041 [Morphnus guianensis]
MATAPPWKGGAAGGGAAAGPVGAQAGAERWLGCGCPSGEEATLWVWLSVRPLGMPLTAAASGLRGLSLPGLPLLAARERRGTGGALTGCGQKLLKLERLQKGKEAEGRLAGSCLPLQARETLPLCVRKDPSSYSTAGQTTNVHHRVEDSQATGVTEEEGKREGERNV